jgi:threonine/homoserine/homoserine lactone efflux protein
MNINFERASGQAKGVLARILAVLLGLLALAAALMFSVVIFGAVAIAGLGLWLYFLWKTRALRQQMREQMAAQNSRSPSSPPPAAPEAAGDIIEGESVRVVDERNRLGE